jgi:antitoxin component HigA of HigAB toxin-antitoxin module
VENILAHRGFLSLVKEGQAANFTTQGNSSAEAIERLVETFQAEMWGNPFPTEDLIAIYENACTARGHSIATISPEDVQAIRTLLEQLSRQWAALPLNEALRLRF